MRHIALAAMFVLAPAQWAPPGVSAATLTLLANAPQITFKICAGWRAWNIAGNLVVVCPGVAPPPGAVELREYYVVSP